ncbi:MAG: 4-(cytidine 5'-diphospho)-2-C-methyl-D-erythritol kinase [Proteobacteria bacterium]|jgi:4-diphosphocytidyl-2-C-methyl-D-erythritol kinase|nr:4-(cytidine 5'-diphospho)-2-C-methyl-D-erythritol kinase [Pseudomonadota bacterium]
MGVSIQCKGDRSVKSWFAPAKLNIFLHIVGRRQDGRHELQTLFQLLDFGDALSFEVTSDGGIARSGALHLPEDDLCVRAARSLQQVSGTRLGARIHLIKRIPIGAGLGGGSSDAATVLVALNHLWQTHLTEDVLTDIGESLGADVPLFVRGGSAWGEGIGERLTPAELPLQHFCVVWPEVCVPTATIFSDPELTRNTPRIRIPGPFDGDRRNDLEPVARRRFPEVGDCLEWLGQFGAARMTGSGGAAFLTVADSSAGEKILQQLPSPLRGVVANGINRNPAFADEPDGV